MKADRVGKCPKCGLQIAAFDAGKTLAHEDPECQWFSDLCSTADTVTVLDQPVSVDPDQSAPNN